ncbi:MAG: MATE family efflux transporter [Anaerovoracaceae bacterium]
MREKKKIDILNGSVWKNVPRFAIPVALTGILEQLFNAADIAVVGRFTGAQGEVNMAAVGANSPIIGLILNLFIGIAIGANVVIANAVGRKNQRDIRKAVQTSVAFAFLTGVVVAILGEFIAEPLLDSMNVPDDVLPQAVLYLRIYLTGLPVIMLYNFESAIFRGVGETRLPLAALSVSGVLNVILNLIFVIKLGMTVNGVALATVISNLTSSIFLLAVLSRTKLPIRIEIKKIRMYKDSLLKILSIGVPAGIQGAVFAIANILVQSAINSLGTTAIAASSAALNIEIFCYDMLNSFSQACTTFVGQNYGAGKTERCRKVLKVCMIEDFTASAICIMIALFFGKQLLSLFNTDPEVIRLGYQRLCIIFAAYTFSMLYEVMSGYMRGFGISLVPAVLTTIGVCGTRFAWIYMVFPHFNTFRSIIMVYPVSLGITAVLILFALLWYRPSRKKAEELNKCS